MKKTSSPIVADYDEKTELITIRDRPASPKFKRFCVGVGWLSEHEKPPADQNWFVVVGETQDGQYQYVEEGCGEMSRVCEQLVDVKDRFLVSTIFADGANKQGILDLRLYDGLSRYHYNGIDNLKRPAYVTPSSQWPHFRSRTQVATILSCSNRDREFFLATLEHLKTGISDQSVARRQARSVFNHALMLPVRDQIQHPVIRAAVWVYSGMKRSTDTDRGMRVESPTSYIGFPVNRL